MKDNGSNARWNCSFNAPHDSSISMALNDTNVMARDNVNAKGLDEICTSGKSIALYEVMEEKRVCDSKYTVTVVVCSATKEVLGNYSILWGQRNVTEGSRVTLRLTDSPSVSASSGTVYTFLSNHLW